MVSALRRYSPRSHFIGIAFGLAATVFAAAGRASTVPMSVADIVQELRSFQNTGTVLYVGAHPDDENNRLLPYLARGRGLRTAYLSLTRGDGGQNRIGPELGSLLGVIRTEELLAARRIDGARQFFARAKDFGFSKDSSDTLQRWDRQQVLADIVRVIRQFQPDVIVTRFSTIPGGTHGHHTASAILALEAFKAAGDPKAFPEQLSEGLAPWSARRIFWNSFNRANFGPDQTPGVLRLEANGFDPLLGESYGEIGARGRSMHKSQGEGRIGVRGSVIETFDLLAGEPAKEDLFDGVDTTWNRFPNGADIGAGAAAVLQHFDPQIPSASVPGLIELRRKLDALGTDPRIADKRAQLDRVLVACLGLFVETTVPSAQVVPGEQLKLQHTAVVRSSVPVRWVGERYPATGNSVEGEGITLSNNKPISRDATPVLPESTVLTQPYWLRQPGTEGMFRVDDAALIGRAESPAAFPVVHVFEVGGIRLEIPDEPEQIVTDAVRGEIRRHLEVIAPVAANWEKSLEVFAPGSTRQISVEVQAARDHAQGTVAPEAASGWKITPASQPFTLAKSGQRARLTFSVSAPSNASAGEITARVMLNGRTYDRARSEIRYDHIPAQVLQFPAETKVVSFEVTTRSRKVAYLPGAGDEVAEGLRQLGCVVTEISGEDLNAAKLQGFDAVVLGVRAFNTRTDLAPHLPALFAWVESGGTLLVQYNRPGRDLKSDAIAPYRLRIGDLRVTDETAAMTMLDPDHPAFTTPNKITAADFDGWVQERGAYFAADWGPEFTPLLECHDPGEEPLRGALLVAKHGKGHLVYANLSFFRQLPAGVPGAYRLLANLISLGK